MSDSTTAKRTPAPWRVTYGGRNLAPECQNIFVDHSTGMYSDPVANCYTRTPESEANARLIAAAPEMLDALRGLLDAMDREDDAASWRNHEVETKARALLARIDGGAP